MRLILITCLQYTRDTLSPGQAAGCMVDVPVDKPSSVSRFRFNTSLKVVNDMVTERKTRTSLSTWVMVKRKILREKKSPTCRVVRLPRLYVQIFPWRFRWRETTSSKDYGDGKQLYHRHAHSPPRRSRWHQAWGHGSIIDAEASSIRLSPSPLLYHLIWFESSQFHTSINKYCTSTAYKYPRTHLVGSSTLPCSVLVLCPALPCLACSTKLCEHQGAFLHLH
jgi:hypothetical protein